MGPRSVIVRAVLPGEVRDTLFRKAGEAGISVSAYVRSLVIRSLKSPPVPVKVGGGFLDPDPLPLPR